MEFKNMLAFLILEFSVLTRIILGQVTLEQLKKYDIDPLDLNGPEPFTDMTIDRLIMQASGGPGMLQNLIIGENNTILAELDMKLTQEQYFSLYEQPTYNGDLDPTLRGRRRRSARRAKKNRTKRKAIRDVILRWKDGDIPYKFVPGHFHQKEEYLIRSAMTEWEKYTCLRFRPAQSADKNLVRFQNGLGCNSQLGMVGGEQPLNLDKNGCRYRGLYLHEIGHAIGLVHEHQLPDRDQYIEILYNNVMPNMRIWFNKYSSQEVDQMKVGYEYSSVMHYGITAFSSDGQSQTIRAKQSSKESSIGRVYKKELSFTDTKIVNLMYNCADHCSDSITCNDGGFVDQNCRCVCPDGTDSCSRSRKEAPDSTCFNANEDWQCSVWANQGECERNPRFMLESCKKACKLCGTKEEDIGPHIALWTWQWLCRFANICPQNWTLGACEDRYDSAKCQTWQDRGELLTNKKWMTHNCKRTCKACTDNMDDAAVACTNKFGNDTQCDKWAGQGECEINSGWMPENCQKSCRMCDKDITPDITTTSTPDTDTTGVCQDLHNTDECQSWASQQECTKNPFWMLANCKKSCNKCKDSKLECKNEWDDAQCTGWARDQECVKNKAWMQQHCHQACTGCTGDGGTDTQTARPTDTPTTRGTGNCVNNHKNDQECNNWAKHGNCEINKWMTKHCAKSCNSCEEEETGEKTSTTQKPDTTDKDGGGGGGGGGGKDTEKTDVTCVDQKTHCKAWSDHGFCEDNPRMAFNMCKNSCRFCNTEKTCTDKHQLCAVWSKGGQCEKNSGYMFRNCKKSCKVC